MEQLLGWSTGLMGLGWFVAGIALAWRRGFGPTMYLPLLVGIPPATVVGPMNAGFAIVLLQALVGSFFALLGGHVAAVVSPVRRSARQAQIDMDRARRMLAEAERGITELTSRTSGSSAATVLRLQASAQRDRLRDIRRELDPDLGAA